MNKHNSSLFKAFLAVCTVGLCSTGAYATTPAPITLDSSDPVIRVFNPTYSLANLSYNGKLRIASLICKQANPSVLFYIDRKLQEIDYKYKDEVDPRKALRAKVALLKVFTDRMNALERGGYFEKHFSSNSKDDIAPNSSQNINDNSGLVKFTGDTLSKTYNNGKKIGQRVLSVATLGISNYLSSNSSKACQNNERGQAHALAAQLRRMYVNYDKQLDPEKYQAKEFADTAQLIDKFALDVEESMSSTTHGFNPSCSKSRKRSDDDCTETIVRSLLVLNDKQLKEIADSSPYGGVYHIDPDRYYLDAKTRKEYEDKIKQYQFDKLHKHYLSLGIQVNKNLTDIFNKFAEKNNLNVQADDGGNFIYQMLVGKLLASVMDKFNIYDDPKYLQDFVKSLLETLREVSKEAVKQAVPKPSFKTVLKFLAGNLGTSEDIVKTKFFQQTYENVLEQGKEKQGEKQREADYKQKQQEALERLENRKISKTDKNTNFLTRYNVETIKENDFDYIYSMSKYYDQSNIANPSYIQNIYNKLSPQRRNQVDTLRLACTALYLNKVTECTQVALFYILQDISDSRYKSTLDHFKQRVRELATINSKTGTDKSDGIKEFSNSNQEFNLSPEEIDKIDESKGGNEYTNQVIKGFIQQIDKYLDMNQQRHQLDQQLLKELAFKLTLKANNIDYNRVPIDVQKHLRDLPPILY